MKVSELSTRSGVPISSIKYYLREGLLQSGVRTATNQANYGEPHLRRLRLIRSMTEIGELPLARVRATLAAVDDDTVTLHDTFGAVMHGLDDLPATHDRDPDLITAHDEVTAWLTDRHWHIDPAAPAPHRLAELITTMRHFGFPISLNNFDDAADHAESAAKGEVAYARGKEDRAAAVESMIVGTVVIERVLLEIRRLSLESASYDLENADSAPPTSHATD
ncbi:MerR family transcriptional regulator [Rhodococcus sp. BP-349]|uniref:MerR family transcriptional regulator n=1 Tax=unclassified Rhodococcus (in: high G+C Gram-positive bacteria) TaxID=192944 RepID=UPI001C9B33F0|nr:MULTISPECIES: MerR family transcriptional regulator [unclassified Rhodococcus (in: high G+C Gram-positive bacteria)]MBY6540367.1 MerR family transcriptional regulator [Rhodococcus sp. BP-363]MBY6545608.1 MerR family transcriptional regulator [Rhodococcus sp. BP-369]MBY6564838.1 MerR family transcriptional regulator [Rhodococcus sp. BP-370]MBY6578226.1 MerR family transcriptional regulator [Rhodococcus sp. BP-364]MBY6587527.1 MerR family transcriptional regulator [Rhodococcus sp. BP-358]